MLNNEVRRVRETREPVNSEGNPNPWRGKKKYGRFRSYHVKVQIGQGDLPVTKKGWKFKRRLEALGKRALVPLVDKMARAFFEDGGLGDKTEREIRGILLHSRAIQKRLAKCEGFSRKEVYNFFRLVKRTRVDFFHGIKIFYLDLPEGKRGQYYAQKGLDLYGSFRSSEDVINDGLEDPEIRYVERHNLEHLKELERKERLSGKGGNSLSFWGYMDLGLTYSEYEENNDAERVFKKALKSNPEEFFYYFYKRRFDGSSTFRAVCYTNLGMACRKIKSTKNYKYLGELGGIRYAVASYKEALGLDPNNVRALTKLAHWYLNGFSWVFDGQTVSEMRREGYRMLRKALELDPWNVSALRDMGDCCRNGIGVDKKDEALGVELYKKGLRIDPENERLLMRLSECYKKGNGVPKDGEIVDFLIWLSKNPTHAKRAVYLLFLAPEKATDGELREMLDAYHEGKYVLPQKQLLAAAEMLVDDQTSSAKDYLILGDFFYKNKLKEKAFEFYTRSLEVSLTVEALCRIAECYWGGIGVVQSNEKTFEYYIKALNVSPTDKVLMEVAACYRKGVGVEKNAEYAEFFEKLKGNEDVARKAVKILLLDLERATLAELTEALDAYDKGLYGLPKGQSVGVRERLVKIGEARYKDCVFLSEYYEDKNPKRALRYYKEGLTHRGKRIGERHKDRIAFLELLVKASRAEDPNANLFYQIGIHYQKGIGTKRSIRKAYLAYRSALEKDPRHAGAISEKRLLKTRAEFKLILESIEKKEDKGAQDFAVQNYLEARRQRFSEVIRGKLKGGGLNLTKLLNDPEMGTWNTIGQANRVVTNDQWTIAKNNLLNVVHAFMPLPITREYVDTFFFRCMQAKDARTAAGKNNMKLRIMSVIDFVINAATPEEGLTGEEMDNRANRARKVIEILADGGKACPDRAVVMLEKAEFYLKMYPKGSESGEDYSINVLANAFKRNAIEAKLVNQNYEESVETYLSYLLDFN